MLNTKSIIRSMLLIGLFMLTVVTFYQVVGSHVSAAGLGAAQDAKNGLQQTTGGTLPTNAEGTLGSIVGTVINVLSIIVGALSVIMIIIGGFKYVVSAGDSSAVSSAKSTIIYAVVGIVVVIFAQTIVKFVVNKI